MPDLFDNLLPPSDSQPAADDDSLALGAYAQRAYLEYALSVVKGRALPDVADGAKPVQRRLLYAMQRMGLAYTGANGARPVKSARVVGDVLGRFHPHGDQAAYDALVRMAQTFSQRYPLIDGQGNFGSRDGDGAAAMRYTEARLAPISRLLLDEIDEGTVDWRPNYDGRDEEPTLLPARLPFVLLNGASGIAVGLATEIPPHNLREVADAAILLLKEGDKAGDYALFAALPAPDFPGGGQIISPAADIREAYRSGRGSVKVRARWVVEDLARGQWQLVVTELPPNTSTQKVMEEVEELSNPKTKLGRKALTQEQLQLKQTLLAVLDAVRDESGKDAPVRLVFEPKSRTVEVAELTTTLLAHTSLEGSVALNLTMIGRDGRPVQKGLRTILTEWLDFRRQTVERRSRHRLGKALDRLHLLEGRKAVLLNIDEVIRIVRASDEPKPALIARFELSERQAEDILEIRLRQLARLEAINIEQEIAELEAEKTALESLLANPSLMKRQLVREIEADAKAHGDARRTLVQEEKKAVAEIRIIDEPVTVVASAKGWVRALKGHEVVAAELAFKPGDALLAHFCCRSVDTLVVLASDGRSFSVPVSTLPGGRGDGAPITTLIDLAPGVRPLHYFAGPGETLLLLAGSTGGCGLLAEARDLQARNRAGKAFLTLEDGEQPLPPVVVQPGHTQVAALAADGRLLVFGLDELKRQSGGGRGLMLMADTDARTPLLAVLSFAGALVVHGSGRGGKPREEVLKTAALEHHSGKRARKGRVVAGFKPGGLRPVTP
jgi:topoisomerase-4 subunit A